MEFEKRYEVLVAGGGVAGVAAALQAARLGMRTALVEKTIFTGGLATAGLINVYLPLCDGRGRQVTFGIAEELLHRSRRYGPGDVPPDWQNPSTQARPPRYRLVFSPAAFTLALDEALEEAGVDVWLDTLVCLPILQGRRVVGLEVENKSGRGALFGDCVVDATGDADVAYRAGAECADGENFLSLWGHQQSLARAKEAASSEECPPLMEGFRLGGRENTLPPKGSSNDPRWRVYHGTTGEEVSRFVLEARKLAREHFRARQEALGPHGRYQLFPITLPAMAQFRMTRRIVGRATLHAHQDGLHFPDSIGLVSDWRRPGPVWEIPYGTLLPENVEGLLVAGRCISSEGDAWEVTRVIPPAALTGQVAGLAAAFSVRDGVLPSQIPAGALQAYLRSQGIPCHLEEVGLVPK